MTGKGRHPVLGVRSPDMILSVVAPIGLAAAAGTALVVDLAAEMAATTTRSLADIRADGPTLAEISPGRGGVALIAGGGTDRAETTELVKRLSSRWPAIVVRVDGDGWDFPVVPVFPLFGGRLAPVPRGLTGVWQPVGTGGSPPGPGPVLPRLRTGSLRRMLEGHLPRRSGWVAAWAPVWEMPWA
ncbi:MAG TPA: hypothetical protein VJ948_05395 [Acidimicrobiia bacterium]|nr:hypothetical protein [Acidimicrobiia bacterium]